MSARQPAGIPTGGQFAAVAQSRSDISLGGGAHPNYLVLGGSRPTVSEDGKIRDGRYDQMTRAQAWADFRHRLPQVTDAYADSEVAWPSDEIVGYTDADPASLAVDEQGAPVDVEPEPHCFVCGRHTDHIGEHEALVEAGLAEYGNDGSVRRTSEWDDTLAREISEREYRDYETRAEILGSARPEHVRAALAYSTDPDGRPLDEDYDTDDFDRSAIAQLDNDLSDFVAANLTDLDGLDPKQIAHDFWLTRNRHGAGFWDRGLRERGDRLTASAHGYGSMDLYVGDDGKVHVS